MISGVDELDGWTIYARTSELVICPGCSERDLLCISVDMAAWVHQGRELMTCATCGHEWERLAELPLPSSSWRNRGRRRATER
jgi:Zn ribbon nucleic-acid-binding protein